MTFLELCRETRAQCGLGGDGPTTTVAQTGEMLLVVNWVQEAWTMVQQMRHWRWMWELATVTIPDGASYATQVVPADRYLHDTAYVGDTPLTFVPWDIWRLSHPSITQSGPPSEWTIRPDNRFQVDAVSSGATVVTVERYRVPTALDGDDDVPELPAEHHMLIVWQAVLLYAGHDEASNLYQHAKNMRKAKLMAATAAEGLNVRLGGALA